MAQFADRVKVSNTTTASAGSATTLTLGSAEAGYQAVPSSLDGETIRYVIEEGNTWEIGIGTYTHSGTTLSRSVTSSSNSNNAIAVTSSSKVFITPVVDDLQFVQVYSSTSDLPSASDNHGRITHVHGDGAMYFAHGGNWVRLANHSDAYTLPTASNSTLGGVKIGTGLSIDGSGVVTASSSGIALTDLSVTQNAASGSGALTYNASTGAFTYTPPASTSSSGGTLDPIKETETVVSASTQSAFNVTHAVGNIAVYLNGSRLSDADWNSNSGGTTVTLTAPAVQNDIVTVVEYGAPFAAPYRSNIYTVGSSSEINANRDVLTADYTQGKEAVYVNGVKYLSSTDYTTNTGGTTITFTSALSAGDKVELVEHGALADAASTFTDLTDTPSTLGTAGQIVQVNSAGNALEFADASSGVSVYTGLSGTDGTPSGATYLLNASSSAGDLAYVTANTGLYQNNGNGWYKIATINTNPDIDSVSETTSGSTTTLSNNGTFNLTAGANTVVTITASDADEGTDLTYTHTVTSGTASNVATITQGTGASENVFTFAPATSVGGTITVRFDVTDNTNTAQFTNSFILQFAADWSSGGTLEQRITVPAASGWGSLPLQYGLRMSDDGDRIAIADKHHDYTLNSNGQDVSESSKFGGIWIYSRSGTTWTFEKAISSSTYNTYLGYHGVQFNSDASRLATGYLYTSLSEVWDRSGTSWSKTTLPNSIGYALIMSPDGNTIIGSKSTSSVNDVKFWDYSGGSWSSGTALSPPSGTNYFGHAGSMALTDDGTQLVIGQWGLNKVLRYSRSSSTSTTWTLRETITGGSGSGDRFGGVLHISKDGKTLAINQLKVAGSNTGKLNIYTRADNGVTTNFGSTADASFTGASGDMLGSAKVGTEVSNDGSYILSEANNNDTGGSDRGQVYVFELDGSTWTKRVVNSPSDVADDDRNGSSTAMSKGDALRVCYAGKEDGDVFVWKAD